MQDFSIFDIVGPNMIGPSSSHTAGACKLGYVAYKLARGDVKEVVFRLHGSFAKTYKGHGTDKALLGGILGFEADDERIRNSFQLAKEKGLIFRFEEADLGEEHPNTVRIDIVKGNDVKLTVLGSSVGGGNIKITEIDGVELEFTGEYPTLIISHNDTPGVTGKVTSILGQYDVNIAFMQVYRDSKGKKAFMIIETDSSIDTDLLTHIRETDQIVNAFLVTIK
ncbi:L-serine ammonia-lyase, iron-sulfur-dependent subunit beta [Alkaliphilus hydrothermalis]|uniref:L-serine deaminase n=1 Tax=Alkaliphilus hydrothermalis TaxID=1482730 RepID=A0ABS2NS78_9FIRM|nr:L-serine ammonia-lyase, iron-sulfur-dependent subunit beta [Alkaliphilus hydrothermalis]MBM7615793.1 L-serine dehydratase [Alkaliphilus hydrothermalis]